MCGIVGAASHRDIVPILIEGIRRLEYRGYDSTGLAVLDGAEGATLERLVSTARVADLAAQAQARHLTGTTGISHTRWATHGAPSPVNAHPHLSRDEVAVVHNGIIENFEALRTRLREEGTNSARRPTARRSRISCTRIGTAPGSRICCARCSLRLPSSKAPTRSP